MSASEARLRRLLQEAHARLSEERSRRTEPVAVAGMACRFPGAPDVARFWDLLARGVDATGPIPSDRWDVDRYFDPDPLKPGTMYVRRGGFLDDVAAFDAALFGIAPREAERMDPQQRLLLELTWEGLEDAGLDPRALAGSATGVFVGVCFDDYARRTVTSGDARLIEPYAALGNTRSLAAGRVAYTLGFEGPALQLDTSCSSSLVALHLAVQSLRAHECDLAVVAGVNVICAPETMIAFCRMRALSPDGRCRTFSAEANGYGRGEGGGVLVLRRLGDSRLSTRTRACVIGSAVNHDGRSNGLTAPNGRAQEAVLRRALAAAAVDAGTVDYVEAHGTGTELGDPIEASALARAYATADRGVGSPLLLGSVKSNIGHLESAAGVAALIKVVLALEQRRVPPTLHARPRNPRIDFAALRLTPVDELTAWPGRDGPARAGVSAFGMSGTNAHVVVEQAPGDGPARDATPPRTIFHRQRYWIDWPSVDPLPGPRPASGARDASPRAAIETVRTVFSRVTGRALDDPGLQRPLRESGLDSLSLVELEAALEEAGVPGSVSPDDTPAEIADRQVLGTADAAARLRDAGQLPADIAPTPGGAPARPRELLLTGATGFLGAFLLADFLDKTDARIHCLVRAADGEAARGRVLANLACYQIDVGKAAERIVGVSGDLDAAGLGLPRRVWEDLADRVDAVVSSGAQVSYLAGFEQLRSSHIDGTIQLLRLACQGAPKRFHHVSSLAVWEGQAYAAVRVAESVEPDACEGIVLPYSQAKWASDSLVRAAARRGLHVTVHRPSLISGHSRTGAWNEGDLLRRLLTSVAASRTFPSGVGLDLDCSPVDYVSAGIVAHALGERPGAWHLQHPAPLAWDRFGDALETVLRPLERVDFDTWIRQVAQRPGDALYPLVPFLRRRFGPTGETYLARVVAGRRALVSTSTTEASLAAEGIHCPPLDAALLARYLTSAHSGER